MKFASFNGQRIGAMTDRGIVDLTDLVAYNPSDWPPVGMVRFIADFKRLAAQIEARLKSGPYLPKSDVAFECPITWPNKLIAFPANYDAHIAEMKTGTGLISPFKADGQGFFLKANSSLSGPHDPIVLPAISGREIHHECELAIIIGRGGRSIPREQALDHIFGYSCLIDVVVRGKEERVMRKSFDSFCPLGPYIVTSDEVGRPDNINLQLSVNGEIRQKANTRDLIVDIPGMIEMASAVMTLHPGDIIASGTPSGVGPLQAGDTVNIQIENVGAMELDVVGSQTGGHSVWKK